jgi:hypothetical protein
MDKEP